VTTKAAYQCSKYAAWARESDEWKKLLHAESIDPSDVKAVRIGILSSEIYADLMVSNAQTSEAFAVVPEVVLFAVMAGVFPAIERGTFKPIFPEIAGAFAEIFTKLQNVIVPNGYPDLEGQLRHKVNHWLKLLLVDRRNIVSSDATADSEHLTSAPFAFFEGFIGATAAWVLPVPILVGSNDGWNYYLGTQLADAGTTYVCEPCRKAIKYYPGSGDRYVPVCPGCKRKLGGEGFPEIRAEMTKLMVRFKARMSKDFYGL
jgi:hypothetical protein